MREESLLLFYYILVIPYFISHHHHQHHTTNNHNHVMIIIQVRQKKNLNDKSSAGRRSLDVCPAWFVRYLTKGFSVRQNNNNNNSLPDKIQQHTTYIMTSSFAQLLCVLCCSPSSLYAHSYVFLLLLQ